MTPRLRSLHRAALLLPLLTGCSPTQVQDGVLATYPGGEITETEFRALGVRPDEEPRRALLRAAVTEKLAAAAQERRLDERRDLTLQLRRIESRPWQRAFEKHLEAANLPTDEEIRSYLDERRDKLDKPRRVRLSNLFQRAPEEGAADAREQVRRKMEALRAEIVAGAEFADVARRESEGVNRYRGGRMGAVAPGHLRAAVERVAFALEEGEVSPVLAIPEGFVLLTRTGEVPASTMSEEEALERIGKAMRRWKYDEALATARSELLETVAEVAAPRRIDRAEPWDTILSISGVVYTYEDIDALARAQSTTRSPQPRRLAPFRIRSVAESFAYSQLVAERARELELELEPGDVARAGSARRKLLADAEIDRLTRMQAVEVPQEEARAFYDANPRIFSVPTQVEVSAIQIRLDGDDPEELRSKTELARSVVDRIRSGAATFAEIAREVSDHPSAEDGGELGLKPRRWAAGLGPNVLAEFDSLSTGEISDPIRQDHLWILRRGATAEAHLRSWEDAAGDARFGVETATLARRRQQIEQELLTEMESRLHVVHLPEVPSSPRRKGAPAEPQSD